MRCGVILVSPLRPPGRHLPFWVRRVSQFRLFAFTAFQTGVPLVSIDRKGSASLPAGWEMSRIVGRLHTSDCAAIGRTLRTLRIITQMRLSNEQHHLSLKGARGEMQKPPSCTRAGACASLAACTCNPGKTVRQAAPLQDCCARRGSLVPGHARSRRDAEDAMIIVPLHGSCTGIGNEAVEMPAEEAWYLAFGGSNPNTGPLTLAAAE
jgi:hypothetical protein